MTKFKILNLDWKAFDAACLQLRSMVETSGFDPDVVIAIPRGGEYLFQSAWSDTSALPITLSRPSKFSIKKLGLKFLPFLPSWFCDRLRIWDAKHLIKRFDHMNNTRVIVPTIPQSVRKILIIDDAVDSGATLKVIRSMIQSMRADLDIRSAAITVTADIPACMPDYYLYHNATLVRMPWSTDAK